MFALSSAAANAADAPTEDADTTPPPAPWDVYLFLERHCAECHGGHVTKPKADIGYILDLRRLIGEAYILPGKPDESDLFKSLVTDDSDLKMPPDDSEGPKPTAEQIAMVRAWITAGAPLGNDAAAGSDPGTTESAVPDGADAKKSRPAPQTVGRMHPLLVHFPIALLLCALVAELAARARPAWTWLHGMVRGSLWAGAPGAIVAAATGWLTAKYEGFVSADADLHRWLGVSTAVLAVLALIVSERALRRPPEKRGRGFPLLALLLLAGLLVTVAGHTGGVLAYGKDYLWSF